VQSFPLGEYVRQGRVVGGVEGLQRDAALAFQGARAVGHVVLEEESLREDEDGALAVLRATRVRLASLHRMRRDGHRGVSSSWFVERGAEMGNRGWDGDEPRTLLLSLTDWSDIATVGSRRAIRAAASASTPTSPRKK
jgi:hypothetical protein